MVVSGSHDQDVKALTCQDVVQQAH
jgi:hypothetical protein